VQISDVQMKSDDGNAINAIRNLFNWGCYKRTKRYCSITLYTLTKEDLCDLR